MGVNKIFPNTPDVPTGNRQKIFSAGSLSIPNLAVTLGFRCTYLY